MSPVEVAFERECGAAEALVRPRIRVNGHVTLKIVMAGKLFAANGALIRLLVRVRHHVSFQSLILREKRPANVAVELPNKRGNDTV